MNRKLLNGLLLVAASCAAVGTFTSCKDNVSDLEKQVANEYSSLEKRVAALEGDVTQLKEDLATAKKNLGDQIDELGKKMGKDLGDMEEKLQKQIDELAKKPHLSTEDVKKIFNDMFTPLTAEDIKAMGFVTSKELEDALSKIASCAVDCVQLEKDVRALEKLYEALEGRVGELEKKLEEAGLSEKEVQDLIDAALISVVSDLEQVKKDIQDFQASISEIEGINESIEGINSSIDLINEQLTNMDADIKKGIEAYNYIDTNKSKLDVLLGLAEDLSDKLGQIDGLQEGLDRLIAETTEMRNQIEDLESKIGDVESTLTEKLNNLEENLGNQINELNSTWTANFEELSKKVDANATAIAALETKVNDLFGQLNRRLNSLITSIITQGTYNPLFGTFSLPIGVQSNMLVNYTGQNDHGPYKFPSHENKASYDNEPMMTPADENWLEMSGNFRPMNIEDGQLFYNGLDDHTEDLYLGKIFTTINPNNINFAGQDLSLVNSRDEDAHVKLHLKKSNELLDFGYTRANNGFYEADALVPATRENFDKIMLRVDDNLKEAAKELLKDRSRSTVFGLMKGVYDQISGILPAYGLKAAWEVDGKEYAVYSNYNIAATTFRPLSYSFLYGKSIDHRLPIIDALSESLINIDPSKYKFEFGSINLDGVTVNLGFTFKDFSLTYDGKLNVEGYVYDVNDPTKVIGTIQAEVTNMNDFLADLNEQLNGQLDFWNTELAEKFDSAITSLMSQIQERIDNMMADMEGEINGKLEQMITDIQNEVNNRVGQYLDKFNNFISKYNELAKKINNVLADPNHYLQLTMLYNSRNNGIHFLSNNIKRPTVFRNAGGDAVTLYPTSYTAEVLAPAYRKFIGCTNVYKLDEQGNVIASAQGRDLNGQSVPTERLDEALIALNNSGEMNQVFKGVQRRFAFPMNNVVTGVVYELVYTAVDYHGTTSTAKFYFTVK
ncbi:MAG: hypothetical protein K2H47_01015 [Muribaculaceae bacterium]|nr:hypothetical protein [Muribaculaceae bacterium]